MEPKSLLPTPLQPQAPLKLFASGGILETGGNRGEGALSIKAIEMPV